MIPPHETYVEPFAGGAAVYFKKPSSEKEVLSDKDREIAFAFRFLRDMNPEQYERLKRYDWRVSRELFARIKASEPKDEVERFRQFYYLRKASYAKGGQQVNPEREGTNIGIDHLLKVHERLKKTSIHGGDAIAVIKKYDSPTAFHYIDPPYPDRAFVGATEKYTEEDLARLIEVLKGIKGKFALSLGIEHAKLLPPQWHIKRVAVKRPLMMKAGEKLPVQYEIIATNYNPDTVSLHSSLTPPPIKRQISDRVLHRERRKVLVKTRRRPKRVRRYNPAFVSLSRTGF
jgi:DNA adenine methylase